MVSCHLFFPLLTYIRIDKRKLTVDHLQDT